MKKLSLLVLIFALVSLSAVSCGKEPVDTPFSPGTVADNVYTSDWLGLTFTPSEDMELSGVTELLSFTDIDADAYYIDEATGEEVLDYSMIPTAYEMLATDMETEGSVLIMAQYADEEMTVDSYILDVKSQLDEQLALESDMGSANYAELTEKKLAGRTYTVFTYTVESYGVTLSQTMYIDKIEDRIANICFTYGDTAELDTFLACFGRK